ncbi:MAG: hypothetical protein KAR20_11550 [Candidatus Heimdallarchaeota archaeon]|nr:hypothetical protein [Candidatus Heimdallarchaeota archaeon]
MNILNWGGVVQQIFEMIGTNTAIIDKYGMILASKIPQFSGKLISPTLWAMLLNRKKLAQELELEEISSVVLETPEYNLVFSCAKYIYLLSEVPKDVDLAQYMPSINRMILTLDKSTEKTITFDFQKLDLSDVYEDLTHDQTSEIQKERMPIFKHLVKYMRKK